MGNLIFYTMITSHVCDTLGILKHNPNGLDL